MDEVSEFIRHRCPWVEDFFSLKHGWEVELSCPECGHVAPPVTEGFDQWAQCKSHSALLFQNSSTIFANVHCGKCHADLKEEAAKQLVERFEDVDIPANNRNAIWAIAFIGIVLLAYLCSIRDLLWQMQFTWVEWLIVMSLGALSAGCVVYIHLLKNRCDCGRPSHKFMGLLNWGDSLFLGHNRCFRCSSCGKLLRLRC